MVSRVHFSSDIHTWETPARLFKLLDREFQFDLDVCAQPETAKCARFFGPQEDGLAQEWRGVCYMNPPYGRAIGKWVAKAFASARSGDATVVCLLPARTDTEWWHKYVAWGEVRFLKGRLRFGNAANGAPFPSAIVVFRPGIPDPSCDRLFWDWEDEYTEVFGN